LKDTRESDEEKQVLFFFSPVQLFIIMIRPVRFVICIAVAWRPTSLSIASYE